MPTDASLPRHRERTLSTLTHVNQHGFRYDWPNNVSETHCEFSCHETTDDENNPWLQYRKMRKLAINDPKLGRSRDKGLLWDVGGPFDSTKFSYEESARVFSATLSGTLQRFFDGRIYPVTSIAHSTNELARSMYWKWTDVPSVSDLDAFGATAISRVAPTNPHSNTLQGIVELRREGLPSLPGYQALRNRSLSPKQLSGEYLNLEFGLKPLINEIRATAAAMRRSEDLIKQYLRDSGRPVRRRYEPPEDVEAGLVDEGTKFPAGGVSAYFISPSQAPRFRMFRTSRKRWFSGAFVYHADDRILGLLGDQLNRAEHLYGLKPDIADLYNVTPWSWLVDWFSNTGDVVNNLKMLSSDGLVMTRGYVMETVSHTSTSWFHGMAFTGGIPVDTRQTFAYTRKVRRRANPFGFGLTEEDLTPRQFAILAALGITRGSRWQE